MYKLLINFIIFALVLNISACGRDVDNFDCLPDLGFKLNKSNLDFNQILQNINDLPDKTQAQDLIYFIYSAKKDNNEVYRASYILGKYFENLIDYNSSDKDTQKKLISLSVNLFDKASLNPVLFNLSLEHEVDILKSSGNEKRLREILEKQITQEESYKYKYMLGQSYFRTKEYDNARKLFIDLISKQDSPSNHNYYVASYYYLGLIDDSLGKSDIEFKNYLKYLSLSPAGRFSKDILNNIYQLPKDSCVFKSQDNIKTIIIACLKNGDYKQANDYLNSYDKSNILEKPFLQAKLNLYDKASNELITLVTNKNINSISGLTLQSVITAVSSGLNHKSRIQFLQKLEPVISQNNLANLWWQLARLTNKRDYYYPKIIKLNQKSNLSAACSFYLDFNRFVKAKNSKSELMNLKNIFLNDANKYSKTNYYSNLLFWYAKICAITKDYNNQKLSLLKISNIIKPDYYVYRAKFLLKQSASNQPFYRSLKNTINLCLEPQMALTETNNCKYEKSVYELVDLHQYKECLDKISASNDESSWLMAFLLATQKQFHLSIDMAYSLETTKLAKNIKWQLAYPSYFQEYVEPCAKQLNIDPRLILAIIREESRFDTKALSSSDAYGLMQLLPSTALFIGKHVTTEINSQNIKDKLYKANVNIKLGAYYIQMLLKMFNSNMFYAVGSYNGGPGAMQSWIRQAKAKNTVNDIDLFVETIPYDESRNYIKKVMSSYWSYNLLY